MHEKTVFGFVNLRVHPLFELEEPVWTGHEHGAHHVSTAMKCTECGFRARAQGLGFCGVARRGLGFCGVARRATVWGHFVWQLGMTEPNRMGIW